MKSGVNQKHGLDRGAVASTQALAYSQATSRWSRSALARCASGVQRNSLGFTHRRPLARSTRPLSPLPNLPSPLSTVAARWHSDAVQVNSVFLFEDLRVRGRASRRWEYKWWARV